jgi:hypothetical protein
LRRPIPGPRAPTGGDPAVREEALKTLYRLRMQLLEQKEPPAGVLEAIEALIAQYERS